ncbi:hypothetical protein RND71_014630 [Anisodus tanguticus]|uniref:Uncharacterized protein n=1 Tax=Anisodus tanguticus TaxID=243964 RepID=A0AAE1SAZ8_9SOLA|nr:hypothetical protein RND71_014630 [Anisodus tanguticus]
MYHNTKEKGVSRLTANNNNISRRQHQNKPRFQHDPNANSHVLGNCTTPPPYYILSLIWLNSSVEDFYKVATPSSSSKNAVFNFRDATLKKRGQTQPSVSLSEDLKCDKLVEDSENQKLGLSEKRRRIQHLEAPGARRRQNSTSRPYHRHNTNNNPKIPLKSPLLHQQLTKPANPVLPGTGHYDAQIRPERDRSDYFGLREERRGVLDKGWGNGLRVKGYGYD